MSAALREAVVLESEAKFRRLYPVPPVTERPVPDPPCRLRDFVAGGWHVVEPFTPYRHNWHIDAICAHLEAVSMGQIRNLLVNVPPGSMKSLTAAVFWPAWEWAFMPWTRWIGASYSPALSTRDALKTRRLMTSAWYRRLYGHAFRFAGDQNAKTRYENDQTGFRIATSVAGLATGERADRLLVDDAHNARERERPSARAKVLDWWDSSFANRVNDPEKSARVVVMQRLHDQDLAGHLLDLGGFEHLMLPAEYEPKRATVTTLGLPDRRTADGELLWPERLTPVVLAEERKRLGAYGYAGQMQQHPIPREGGMFKRHWWRRYRHLPRLVKVRQFMDTAMKEAAENDYSVIATWGLGEDGNYYVLDIWRQRQALPTLTRSARDVFAARKALHGGLALVIEDKGYGTGLLQTFWNDGPGVTRVTALAFPDPESTYERDLARLSKEARAEQATPYVEAGQVYLPDDAPWVEDFIAEHERFPSGEHDDQVDTTSMALIRFNAPAKKAERPPLAAGRSANVVSRWGVG